MQSTLIIMAAGMGSRFGGLKQLEPVGYAGETIAEFSAYDALEAGFSKVVFVIKPEMEADFRQAVTGRMEAVAPVALAFQSLDRLPQGVSGPAGREKPWGTAHATWCARHLIDGPFAVVNADDFYGRGAMTAIYDYLAQAPGAAGRYCMPGYRLGNTVSEHGSVSRGVCDTDDQGRLLRLDEQLKIYKAEGGNISKREGKPDLFLPDDTFVSMNAWGLTPDFMNLVEDYMRRIISPQMPIKGECYLPLCIDDLIQQGKAQVAVLPTQEKWYGFTYQEDKVPVITAIRGKIDAGEYPRALWKKG